MEKINFRLNFLLAIFAGLLVAMNLLGGKVTTILGISVSVGIFMVPLTFLITDIVEEVYGRKIANHFVLSGVILLCILFLYTSLFVVLPANERYQFNDQYKTIFGASLRMIIASIVAFALAQFHDVWAFNFWKQKTKGKWLWLRNNLSTIVSQAIDTFVFMMIAFYGISPKFDFWFIIQMAIPYFLFKVVFAIIDTPFVYLGVKWLRGNKENKESLEQKNKITN